MNKLKLKTLEMQNFGIYKGDVKLNFEGKSVIGVLAQYHNDPSRSNRSGKSLIIEAIRYLLTGLSRAKKNSKMIYHGEDIMLVTGVFVDDDGKEYVISRGVDSKSKSVLNVDWTEKIKDGDQAISELFGISKEDFDLTSFFKQSDIHGFMDLGAAEKTKFLMKWMDNEHWKFKHLKVMEDVKAFETRLRDNESTKRALEASLEISEDIEVELNRLISDNKKLLRKRDKTEAELIEKRATVANFQKSKNEYKAKTTELRNQIEEALNKQKKLTGLQKLNKELLKENKDLQKDVIKINVSEDKLKEQQYETKSLISEQDKLLIKINSNEGGICPVINELCDRITFSKKDKKDCEGKIKELKETLRKIASCLIQHKSNNSILRDIDDNEIDIDRNKSVLKEIKLNKDVDVIKEKLEKLEQEEEIDIDDLVIEGKELKAKANRYDSIIRDNDRTIGALEQRIAKSKKAVDEIDAIVEKNEKLKTRLEYIAKMFSRTGIPADEIDNAFQEIQDDINYILKKLDCGLTVCFRPDKELNAWEGACSCGFTYPKGYRKSTCEDCESPRLKKRKDEISLKILENGEEADFDMDSGGGKTIISYAIRIALTMLKRRQNKARLNMLFLDEVDSALDSHLASTITSSITNILTKELGYDQIIMVSHKEEIKNSVPNILEVTRFENYSKVRFAS